jgi:hypothetical protein
LGVSPQGRRRPSACCLPSVWWGAACGVAARGHKTRGGRREAKFREGECPREDEPQESQGRRTWRNPATVRPNRRRAQTPEARPPTRQCLKRLMRSQPPHATRDEPGGFVRRASVRTANRGRGATAKRAFRPSRSVANRKRGCPAERRWRSSSGQALKGDVPRARPVERIPESSLRE